jgi:hypothetical protein
MVTATHIESLKSNMAEVNRLLEIHAKVAGTGVGRKRDVEVLNKSAIVLLLACWEAYVEDTAVAAFDRLLATAKSPEAFPEFVLAIAAKEIKKADTMTFWGIAKDGWKPELVKHRDRVLEKYVERGSFNTPSADNIDRLFSEMIGLTSVSRQWFWPSMTPEKAAKKLQDLIDLRGGIAHRVSAAKPIKKADVTNYKKFLYRLAVITHNRTSAFLYARTKIKHWGRYRYGNTR